MKSSQKGSQPHPECVPDTIYSQHTYNLDAICPTSIRGQFSWRCHPTKRVGVFAHVAFCRDTLLGINLLFYLPRCQLASRFMVNRLVLRYRKGERDTTFMVNENIHYGTPCSL